MPDPYLRAKTVSIEQQTHQIIHIIDQFSWVADALNHGNATEQVLRKSVICFSFPHGHTLTSADLTLIGEGNANCDTYFTSLDSKRKQQTWQLFKYRLSNKKRIFCPQQEPLARFEETQMFTTVEYPFLHRGDYPPEFDRVYLFPLFASEYLKIRAHPSEQKKERKLTLTFVPDNRNGKPYDLATIVSDGSRWYSPQVNS